MSRSNRIQRLDRLWQYQPCSLQPRSQGLSYYRPLERTRFAPGGGKMRDPGNEVVQSFVVIVRWCQGERLIFKVLYGEAPRPLPLSHTFFYGKGTHLVYLLSRKRDPHSLTYYENCILFQNPWNEANERCYKRTLSITRSPFLESPGNFSGPLRDF